MSDPFQTLGPWSKTNSRTWKTKEITVNDARFQNSQPGGSWGADFRIDCMGDGNEYIHLVEVERGGGGSQTHNIALQQGWNLVSFNVNPSDTSVSEVLSSIDGQYSVVQSYLASDASDPWKIYDPSAPPIASDLSDLDVSMGFWINMNNSATLSVSGTAPSSTNIQLRAGWNMIGSVMCDVSIENPQDIPDGSVQPFAYWYDPATDSYLYTTTIEPAKGYWVAATEDCQLTLSCQQV